MKHHDIDLTKKILGLHFFTDKQLWIIYEHDSNSSKGGTIMLRIRITARTQTTKKLEKVLYQAENRGDLRIAKRIMAILA